MWDERKRVSRNIIQECVNYFVKPIYDTYGIFELGIELPIVSTYSAFIICK